MAEKAMLIVMDRQKRASLLRHLDGIPVPLLTACRCTEVSHLLSLNSGVGVVLTDTELPDGTWETLLHQVQRDSPETQVVVCSSYPTPELVSAVFEDGAFDILLAPYTADEVKRAVASALDRSAMVVQWRGVC